jgi:hypothetical protein
LVILVIFLGTASNLAMYAQDNDESLPPFSKGWTDSEKAQFRYCVSQISDPSRENTTQLSADKYACMILEEEQHWMSLHPEAHGKKEDSSARRKCFAKHPLQVKSTPEEFHASFDLCMCAAYGIPGPKSHHGTT